MRTRGWEGVQNLENFADVIYGRPQSLAAACSQPAIRPSSLLFPIVQIRHRRRILPLHQWQTARGGRGQAAGRSASPLGTPTLASINRTSIHQAAKFAFKRGGGGDGVEATLITAAPIPAWVRRLPRRWLLSMRVPGNKTILR